MNLESEAANTLRRLLSMSSGELASRRTAWGEVQVAGIAVLDELMLATTSVSAGTEDDAGKRALRDAQETGQAKPLVRTVVIEAIGARIEETQGFLDITTHDDAARGERVLLDLTDQLPTDTAEGV